MLGAPWLQGPWGPWGTGLIANMALPPLPKSWNVQNELVIQNNRLNKHLPFYREKVQLLYDSNHFHSQYILIAYFFFKLGESHEGRRGLLVPPLAGWLSHWAVVNRLWWWALAVQLFLCQLFNLHVSYSVMFVYTFNGCRLLAFYTSGHVVYVD